MTADPRFITSSVADALADIRHRYALPFHETDGDLLNAKGDRLGTKRSGAIALAMDLAVLANAVDRHSIDPPAPDPPDASSVTPPTQATE